MSTIDELAATIRERLDAIEDDAARGYLHAPEIPGYTGWDKRTCAGLPPAVSVLVQRDVAAKRALLDRILAEPHYAWDDRDEYGCQRRTPELYEIEPPCTCNRDARVAGYLRLLAQAWQETT